MTWNPTSPITGAAQTGFTSPTYTLSSDTFPGVNGKQHAITALGGTQAGVTVHSVSAPFTVAFTRPINLRVLPPVGANGVTIGSIPRNVYKVITRKGVTPASGQNATVMLIETSISVPAGADTYDAANVRAALSAHLGALAQQSAGIGDTAISAVM